MDIDIYGRIFDSQINSKGGLILKNLKKYKGVLPGHCHLGGAGNSHKELGLTDYKYHLCCENSFEKGYFTEKIADPILCECLPFYDGCTNINGAIDSRAYIKININNMKETYNIIKTAIKNNEWEKRIKYIREAKYKLLTELNFMAKAFKIINQSNIS